MMDLGQEWRSYTMGLCGVKPQVVPSWTMGYTWYVSRPWMMGLGSGGNRVRLSEMELGMGNGLKNGK